jgi:hypothetical protein
MIKNGRMSFMDAPLQDISTPNFSTKDFSTLNFSTPDPYGVKKSGVNMTRL